MKRRLQGGRDPRPGSADERASGAQKAREATRP